eukprot:m.61621 g.61621  ORF g.61621 m.61621 type:complete len:64 (+) comp19288_c0_seq4:116-307(+)
MREPLTPLQERKRAAKQNPALMADLRKQLDKVQQSLHDMRTPGTFRLVKENGVWLVSNFTKSR